MKKPFNFNLGNRGLLPEEVKLADSLNNTLKESAARNGRRLKQSALVSVKVVDVAGHPVHRAVARDKDPMPLPLASA